MSVVHSHIHTAPPNPQFPFNDSDPQNIHKPSDVPRTMNPSHIGGQLPLQQQSMLSLYGPPQQQQQAPQPNHQFSHLLPHQQQQQQQAPPVPHHHLAMMPSAPGLAPNSGGQAALQHQQLQHAQQRAAMMQRAMANPQMAAAPGPFPPGGPAQMRRISGQGPPHPQGVPPIAGMGMQAQHQSQNPPPMMGMPQSITNQLRQGGLNAGLNARMLGGQVQPQNIPPEMALAMARHPAQQQAPQQQQIPQQMQQPPPMVNNLQQGPLPRAASGGQQAVGTPHQIPHLQQQGQQPQRRTPFQQQGPLPQHQPHAASPARPSSHHSQAGTPGGPMVNATPVQHHTQTSPEHVFMSSLQPPPPQAPQQPPQPQPQQQPMFPAAGPQQQQQLRQQPPPFAFTPQETVDASANRTQSFTITPVQQLQQLQQSQEPFTHGMVPQHAPQRSAASRPDPGPSRSPPPQSRLPHTNPANPRPSATAAPPMQPLLPASSPHHRRMTSVGGPPAVPEAPQMTLMPQSSMRPYSHAQFPPSVLGMGQGIMRLLSFSAAMANEKCDRLKYDHWNKIITEYFAPQSLWKLTLWKDNELREAKPFEIGPSVIAMLLLVSCSSGVRSMSFVLDGARERIITPGTATVECPDAQWVWRFYDGHIVVLRGGFSCQVSAFYNRNAGPDQPPYTLKFESMSFDSNSHERYLGVDAIRGTRTLENVQKTPATTTQGSPDGASSSSSAGGPVKTEEVAERQIEQDPRVVIEHALLPQEPINSFGIPQASMRCLELAESVGQMTDLFAFGWQRDLGPHDALNKMSAMIRQSVGMAVGAPAILPGKQAVSLFGNGADRLVHPAMAQPRQQQAPQQQQLQQPPQPQQQQQQQQPQLPLSSQPIRPTTAQAGPSHSPQQQTPTTPTTKGPGASGVSAPSGPNSSLKRKQQPEVIEPPNKRITRRKSKAG